jgi:SAM-dependent methyltransferase
VGDFSAEWLALREPADHAARAERLAVEIVHSVGGAGIFRVLDLGSGTGSNVRYLAPRLPRPQHWILVDRDADLLYGARRSVPHGIEVDTRQLDLRDLEGKGVRDALQGRALVTASALLDLVSAPWLDALADLCAGAGAAALFALSYDGRFACTPADEHDELVRHLVNLHQRRDKGFGPALGPSAADHAVRAFAARGYRPQRERSDWIVEPGAGDLQRALILGWNQAAVEIAPADSAALDAWRARRLAHVDAGRSSMRLGHEDVLALPHVETKR